MINKFSATVKCIGKNASDASSVRLGYCIRRDKLFEILSAATLRAT
ncbi:hypothetical protein JCM14469_43640 [Desulfatiferula olefinivorans]